MKQRGRPIGTVKREAAKMAVLSIHVGDCTNVRDAALANFHHHVGRVTPFTTIEPNEAERFRDFLCYVEEELRRTKGIGLRRKHKALEARYINRRRQRGFRAVDQLKQAMTEAGLIEGEHDGN